MKVKLLVFAAALLMLTSLSFAQPFTACIFNDCFQLTNGPSGDPLADGTVGTIYWDANGDGVDPTDLPAVVCNNPPLCPDGPPGTVNFNTFVLNAGDAGFLPGEFFMDPCFNSSGILPVPPRYYLVVPAPNGGHWTSAVLTFTTGPQDVDVCNWTWSTPPPPQCEPIPVDRNVVFQHGVSGPQNQPPQCVVLCTNFPTVHVCIPGIDGPNHVPTVSTTGTCECGIAGIASGYSWSPWVYDPTAMTYCADLTLGANGEDGSVCLTLDNILAVSVTDVKVLPLDNAVSVSFKSMSETNMDRYEIVRDSHVMARLNATNNAEGATYSYVDNSATNGTVYSYEIVAYGTDGSRTVVATESAAPSMDHAVVTEYALHQNFPNPFNPTTSIRFDLVQDNFVSLKIYNANGQVVATVVNGNRHAGVNIINFDATNLTSGLYFYTVKIGNVYSATKKMLLVK